MPIHFSERSNYVQSGLPVPDLRHLQTLTDDTGMLQHAKFSIPDRNHGYCTDDNARALIAVCKHYSLYLDESVLPAAQCYLAFLYHAFNRDEGRFRNFMSYDRRWLEPVGSEDSHGRALWALGIALEHLPEGAHRDLALNLFAESITAIEGFTSPRAWGFALLGLNRYLTSRDDDSTAGVLRLILAEKLHAHFTCNGSGEWPWCEQTATYANGVLPGALLATGKSLDDREMIDSGLRALRWLLDIQTSQKGHLSIIGNQGWFPRSGVRAPFDQQPLEAMALALASIEACNVTDDEGWMQEAHRCVQWFLGENDRDAPLYDENTGGCRDGLTAEGVNRNQGAESTLAWLITLLSFHELIVSHNLSIAFKGEYANLRRSSATSAFVRTNGHT